MNTDDGVVSRHSAGIALLGESKQARKLRKRLTRHSRIHTASIFVPMSPTETPEHHFPLQSVFTRAPQPRFVNRYDSREILLVVDGSCINNGSKNFEERPPAGGCSFTYKGPGTSVSNTAFPFSHDGMCDGGQVGFPLEECGPGGESHDPSSNRAKLRAVIAALEFRAWQEEGWKRIVIATDLQYVAYGATTWLPVWAKRQWRTRKSKPVINRDLWEELSGIIEKLYNLGTEVSFWLLPPGGVRSDSALVRETKEAAREAATTHYDAAAIEFTRLCGIMV